MKCVPAEEDRARVFCFLADFKNARFVQILEAFSSEERTFAKMAEKLVEDARCLENDKDFYSVMNDLWNNYLKPDEKSGNVPVQYDDARILAKFVSTKDAPVIVCALLEMIVRMPPASQQQIIRAIGRLAKPGQSMVKQVAKSLVSLRTTSGKMVSYGIVACALAWEVFQSVRSWWKGEISGARCVKNASSIPRRDAQQGWPEASLALTSAT